MKTLSGIYRTFEYNVLIVELAQCDTLSWFDHIRFCTTIRANQQKKMLFESSSKKERVGMVVLLSNAFQMWFHMAEHILTKDEEQRRG